MGVAYEAFPHIPAQTLDRLRGELGLRIGQDNVTLLPLGGDGPNLVDNLRVMNTRFGSVFVPSGSHKEIPQAGVQYTQEAKQLCSARFSRNGSWVGPGACHLVRSLPSLMDAEELGSVVPRCCERCAVCQKCEFRPRM